MFTHESYVEALSRLPQEYEPWLPPEFWSQIGAHWFLNVAPEKAEAYGVEGLQRLGPRHCVSDFTGCFYRWKRMMQWEQEGNIAYNGPKIKFEAIVDAFGYAVLMSVLSERTPQWDRLAKPFRPEKDVDLMLSMYWDDVTARPVDTAAVTMATRCAVNMFRYAW